jgi:hypothetical protein
VPRRAGLVLAALEDPRVHEGLQARRTWHATVLAAVGLAVSEGASGSDAAPSAPSPAWSAR